MLNHHPKQQGVWFPYNNWRYKDYYDIKLKNGDIVENCRPNSDAWYPHSKHPTYKVVYDKDVAEVRLKPDDELHDWAFTGEERIKRNLEMFSGSIPPYEEPTPV